MQGLFVTFHNCSHGGYRPKLTSLFINSPWFDHLAVLCDGSHPHKSWAPEVCNKRLSFVTCDEAAYPLLLCRRIVIVAAVHDAWNLEVASTYQEQAHSGDKALQRLALGVQPRGSKVKPLVSEFCEYVHCACSARTVVFLQTFLDTLAQGF